MNKRTMLSIAFFALGLNAGGFLLNPAHAARATPLNAVERADVTFMREEEKLARDVYLQLFQAWGNPAFSNISSSEQRHMDAILRLLQRYQVSDPAVGTAIGEFRNASLSALYAQLMAMGDDSALAALRVGALIEEVDIDDLVDAIERSRHQDLDQVYDNLMCGSRNHLRTFAGQIETLTLQPYQAQMLDQSEVDTIIRSAQERCGG